MSADVRMDYDGMEELIQAFRKAADELAQTSHTMSGIASKLEDGALVNRRGEMWVDLLRNRLVPYLGRGVESMDEMARDLMGALVDLRDGDSAARSRFSG